ncbi:hypothetical protein [Methylobacter sp.]|uniref:hypothetical protein n=1 Tax=Methylobacter sp. TaxID=2051955 RepID=UPI00248897FD|nr:hypothetical protein [Methylobacter sp.]MDI1278834.1 hypothetical protein [Methylobacter sp.]MDI1359667.1 hypothetical protein [Methylobacter sp.]
MIADRTESVPVLIATIQQLKNSTLMLNIGDMDLADKLLFHVAMLALSIEGNAFKLRLKRLLLVLVLAGEACTPAVCGFHAPTTFQNGLT